MSKAFREGVKTFTEIDDFLQGLKNLTPIRKVTLDDEQVYCLCGTMNNTVVYEVAHIGSAYIGRNCIHAIKNIAPDLYNELHGFDLFKCTECGDSYRFDEFPEGTKKKGKKYCGDCKVIMEERREERRCDYFNVPYILPTRRREKSKKEKHFHGFMKFGKYKGERISDVYETDKPYLEWLATENGFFKWLLN